MSSLDRQVGGSHYDMPISHSEFCHANKIGYLPSNIMKYLVRYENKNGLEDLKKAYHYLEILMELEYGYNPNQTQPQAEENV